MEKIWILFFFVSTLVLSQTKSKKLPSISYQNVINCYPELKNEKLEFDVDLDRLRKSIGQKFPSIKSILRYRKVMFSSLKLGPESHRLTISLQKWVRNVPEYDFYLEKIDKNDIAEIVPLPKEKFKNPIKEVPQKYLLDVTILDDEYLWFDTMPGKMEMTYKINQEKTVELDLSNSRQQRHLKCENKKAQGVLCLCLKR